MGIVSDTWYWIQTHIPWLDPIGVIIDVINIVAGPGPLIIIGSEG